MARVKRGVTSHRRHKKILELTKGHRGGRSKLIQQARESLLHAGQYAFAHRKQRRRDLRRLWITRMSAALDQEGIPYSKFIATLKAKNILLNRKILSEIAAHNILDFKKIVSQLNNPKA